ncbi:MAG TPA: hypothetical protein VGK73_18925 [Polyangiaceae bacterium]
MRLCYEGLRSFMRLALLAASSYATSSELADLPSAEVDLELLGQRLSEPDAGFSVMAFRAERRLGEAIEQVLSDITEPIEQLFFYFAGYVVVSDERGPALLLDGERLSAFSLKRLKRVLTEKSRSSFAVLDTITAFDAEQPPQAAVQALAAGLFSPDAATHLLVANRPEPETSGRSPFTSLLELVLDWQSVKSEPLGADGLYAAMRAEESMFAELPAVEHFRGAGSFELLRPAAASGSLPSIPPPRAPSEAPPPEAFAGDSAPSSGERTRALELASAASQTGDHASAIEQLRLAIRSQPRDAEAYRGLLGAFRAAKRPDASWNAASVLDVLGAAELDDSLLASAHRPEGLLSAQGTLPEVDWQKKLFCPDRDAALDGLFAALGDAVLELGLETARRKRRLPALEPGSEQDPEKSTTMLARTLLWSSRVLGILRPKLHVLDSVSGDLAVAPVAESTVIAGKALGSGLGLPDLAFLWARCLVFLRPEHRALALFQGDELEGLVRAAQALGSSNGAPRSLDADAKLFLRGLKRHLRGSRATTVAEAAALVPASGLRQRLSAFRRSVDRAAGRAGLLACGNLELATKLTQRFPQKSEIAADAQVADLFAFAVSDEYGALRERLGVAVRAE